jgi:hypothetical protein
VEKVCKAFLCLTPTILGRLSHDPAVEAAVNEMMPFPLRQEQTQAVRDLEAMAAGIVQASQAGAHLTEKMASFPGESQRDSVFRRLWRRAPA